MTEINNAEPSKENPKKTPAVNIAISKNSKILALFAIACTITVGLVNELTQDKIAEQKQKALLKTLHAIIEPSRHDNNIANDCSKVSSPALGSNKIHTAYFAKKNDKVVAIAITSTAPDGYNGNIDLITGINIDGSISGVRVLEHKETPGLGDKVELRKSAWIHSFNDKRISPDNERRWAVIKDNGMFDQFTGATITPRAVVKAVKSTLLYFVENQNKLISSANDCANTTLDSSSDKSKTEIKINSSSDASSDINNKDALKG